MYIVTPHHLPTCFQVSCIKDYLLARGGWIHDPHDKGVWFRSQEPWTSPPLSIGNAFEQQIAVDIELLLQHGYGCDDNGWFHVDNERERLTLEQVCRRTLLWL